MAEVARRLAEAGFHLPSAPTALGAYVPSVAAAGLVFTSGQLPMLDGALMERGLVGVDVSADRAAECAAQCSLNALAAASLVCDLDSVLCAVKLTGYVASAEDFTAQPSVIDGASAVLAAAFGDAGLHAREAVGVRRLPLDAPVEVSLILALR